MTQQRVSKRHIGNWHWSGIPIKQNKKEAERKFKQVAELYEVLSENRTSMTDRQRRVQWWRWRWRSFCPSICLASHSITQISSSGNFFGRTDIQLQWRPIREFFWESKGSPWKQEPGQRVIFLCFQWISIFWRQVFFWYRIDCLQFTRMWKPHLVLFYII